jgi:hypothetical protein
MDQLKRRVIYKKSVWETLRGEFICGLFNNAVSSTEALAI